MQITRMLNILMISMSLVTGAVAPAFAQGEGAGGLNAADADVTASTAKPTKLQRKQARKEARAKKNAELKKLEAAGYHPARNDPNYPENLRNAEKKAGVGQGASQ